MEENHKIATIKGFKYHYIREGAGKFDFVPHRKATSTIPTLTKDNENVHSSIINNHIDKESISISHHN